MRKARIIGLTAAALLVSAAAGVAAAALFSPAKLDGRICARDTYSTIACIYLSGEEPTQEELVDFAPWRYSCARERVPSKNTMWSVCKRLS